MPIFKPANLATSLLLLAGLAPGAYAGEWAGRYTYEGSYGKSAGGSYIGEQYVIVLQDEAPQKCEISISGYQRDEKLLCELSLEPHKITLLFKSYESGSTKNQYGVSIYAVDRPLLTLEHVITPQARLITYWHQLGSLDSKQKTSGVYFKQGAKSDRNP